MASRSTIWTEKSVSASTGRTARPLRKTGLLEPWEEMAQKYRNGEISREEYDQWRYRYPRSEAERNEKCLKEYRGE